MCGHGHDRAGAVVSEHVVRGPDRDQLTVDGVRGVALQENTALGARGVETIHLGDLLDVLEILGELSLGLGAGGELRGELGISCNNEEGRAVQSVGPGRIDGDRLSAAADLELDLGAD